MKRATVVIALTFLALVPRAARAQEGKVETNCAPTADALTPDARAAIEAQVLEAAKRIFASGGDVDSLSAAASKHEGLCVFETTMAPCRELEPMLRQLKSKDNPRRVVRQEVEGEEVRAVAVTPTVAVVGATVRETRSYRQTGEVSRKRYTHLMVFVLEDGQWRLHSATQSSWPITP